MMRHLFNEKNQLPITFQYIELIKRKKLKQKSKTITYYIPCEKYQTNFYVREEPYKHLVRIL
ncbi:hypothetical protein QE441_003534 [Chryseobacterium sp. SORGH_AS909]|uniref:Uncharacterized protein n=1 Tax=Chryseobacterium camelliae TaxID=1265445 RepID=A0ABU0THD6_9FLAO|nr:hypothetical protein [Chryseobacterium camelliae]MDQ1100399.1 hypothetical protein [Chryseobacterium sp. SORGH_AS_1048]MDR6087740.1 hypothetical protein [Chryseobacterium sp. SORGH_AS_0909]MDR6132116.1 hypothetical protein [Chryseobacterium sp. SORGH_AS_1175]MDT3405733.1 hypothetical protein [Pseudacidovorax intermedius]